MTTVHRKSLPIVTLPDAPAPSAPALDTYKPTEPKGVALRGLPLRIVAALANTWGIGRFIKHRILTDSGLAALRAIDVGHTPRMGAPLLAIPYGGAAPAVIEGAAITALHERYCGGYDPVTEAQRFLERYDTNGAFVAVDHSDVIAQAEASRERYAKGESLSPFDGALVAIKDQIDVAGYPTQVGTKDFADPKTEDAALVARLRQLGAIIVGKTNVHELGIGVTGVNPHHGAARNAHDPTRVAGGSSGGSAVAAALGLVHLAIGSDAGGSTRIPAALNGVVGLKPTFGAWPTDGVFPLAPTLSQPGPIAAEAEDVAMAFTAVSGRPVGDLHDADLRGLRIGVDSTWNEHAEPEIREGTAQAIERFRSLGAEIVEVQLRGLNEAGLTQMGQYVTELNRTLDNNRPAGSSAEAKLTLALGEALDETDRAQLERLRGRITAHLDDTFEIVDVILSPATAIRPPKINERALTHGESDLTTVQALNRYAGLANLTGAPALTFPSPDREPSDGIGIQVIGAPHEEALLLRLAAVVAANRQHEVQG